MDERLALIKDIKEAKELDAKTGEKLLKNCKINLTRCIKLIVHMLL